MYALNGNADASADGGWCARPAAADDDVICRPPLTLPLPDTSVPDDDEEQLV